MRSNSNKSNLHNILKLFNVYVYIHFQFILTHKEKCVRPLTFGTAIISFIYEFCFEMKIFESSEIQRQSNFHTSNLHKI